jgi:hypothetical protein
MEGVMRLARAGSKQYIVLPWRILALLLAGAEGRRVCFRKRLCTAFQEGAGDTDLSEARDRVVIVGSNIREGIR